MGHNFQSPEMGTHDVIIVGAGFSGLNCLHELRKRGFNAKILECAPTLGGVWYWNRYPGCRVDSEFFVYQFHQPEISKDFSWTQRIPHQKEIREYFRYIDELENFSKDIQFNTLVTGATFNDTNSEWRITTKDHGAVAAKYLFLCTGISSRRYIPSVPGLETFKGSYFHTALWPENKSIALEGKRVAVIGTGASGVQVIQELGPIVSKMTVFQRSPCIAFPMVQVNLNDKSKRDFPKPDELTELLNKNRNNFTGLGLDPTPKDCNEDSPEDRLQFFETLYAKGVFHFLLSNYRDIRRDQAANDICYAFWRDKTRARIQNPIKQELVAPMIPAYPVGAKRPTLETSYYEVLDRDNVDIIDVRKNPILEITTNGIKTEEKEFEVDVIVFATGFDAVTGGILDIDIVNGKGETINQRWENGIWTNLGLATKGFPNMFFFYGPQAPTILANGPTACIIQAQWVAELLEWIREHGNGRVEATPVAEIEWKQRVLHVWDSTLFGTTDSWYNGSNVPGKVKEPLMFFGGLPAYNLALKESARNNYSGFDIV